MKFQINVRKDCRTYFPASLLKAVELENGGSLSIDVENDGARMTTPQQDIEAARRILQKNPNWQNFTVEDFLHERREEAKREEEKWQRLESSA